MNNKNEKKEIVKIKKSFIPTLIDNIKAWANNDFYTQTFTCGASQINDLMCFIDSISTKNDSIINNKNMTNLNADLLIISGFINQKKLKLIKEEYANLRGQRFVVTIGSEIQNTIGIPTYNLISDLNEHVPVTLHIHGNPPSLRDILNGLNTLKELKDE